MLLKIADLQLTCFYLIKHLKVTFTSETTYLPNRKPTQVTVLVMLFEKGESTMTSPHRSKSTPEQFHQSTPVQLHQSTPDQLH